MIKTVLILPLLLFSWSVYAQNDSDILLMTKVEKDLVTLRWVPKTMATFEKGLKEGYRIEKKNLSTGNVEEISIPGFSIAAEGIDEADTNAIGIKEYIEGFLKSADEKNKEMVFSLLSIGASTTEIIAELTGVKYHDNELDAQEYEYFVSTGNSKSNVVLVKVKEITTYPKFQGLVGESRVDLKEAYLKFPAKKYEKEFSGYSIYKSFDNKSFEKVNEVPLYFFTSQFEPDKSIVDFVDNQVEEGKSYYYKVGAIDYFAQEVEFSNTIEVYIQKRLNGICKIDTVLSEVTNRNIVGYYQSETKDELSEFILYQGERIDSTYTLIAKQKANNPDFSFDYDAKITSGDRNYFKVAAVSVDGDTAYSYPYYHFSLDQIPPGIPTEFQGEIDSNGVVLLNWVSPLDKDIRGYRVFRSNSEKGEFVEVTRRLSPKTEYRDTLSLNTLTNEVYYKISAIDLNFNNGEVSEPILVMKPDTIKPVPSNFYKYNVSKAGIVLAWYNSGSEDVNEQIILRKNKMNQIDSILVFNKERDSVLDTSCEPGQKYEYRIITRDYSGNFVLSKPLRVEFELGYRGAPILEEIKVNREEKNIILNWSEVSGDVYSIQIYKAKGEGAFRLYKTLYESTNSFTDSSLKMNNIYRYKIKVMYSSGKSSKMSEAKEVMY